MRSHLIGLSKSKPAHSALHYQADGALAISVDHFKTGDSGRDYKLIDYVLFALLSLFIHNVVLEHFKHLSFYEQTLQPKPPHKVHITLSKPKPLPKPKPVVVPPPKPKPKVISKPIEPPKPKPLPKPKPVIQPKPKVQPKPVTPPKPKVQAKPKVTQQAKAPAKPAVKKATENRQSTKTVERIAPARSSVLPSRPTTESTRFNSAKPTGFNAPGSSKPGNSSASSRSSAATSKAPSPSSAGDGNGKVTGPIASAGYLHNPAPAYPDIAMDRGWEGRVLMKVHVQPNGKADSVSVIKSSGKSVLDDAAVKTVKRWSFVPAKRGNTPIAGWVTVPITFNLQL